MKIFPKGNHLQHKTQIWMEIIRELLENTEDTSGSQFLFSRKQK